MIMVSKDRPYLITGGITTLGEITYSLQKEHQENIILFVDVVHPTTSLFVMACIEQLISKTTKTNSISPLANKVVF